LLSYVKGKMVQILSKLEEIEIAKYVRDSDHQPLNDVIYTTNEIESTIHILHWDIDYHILYAITFSSQFDDDAECRNGRHIIHFNSYVPFLSINVIVMKLHTNDSIPFSRKRRELCVQALLNYLF